MCALRTLSLYLSVFLSYIKASPSQLEEREKIETVNSVCKKKRKKKEIERAEKEARGEVLSASTKHDLIDPHSISTRFS